MSDDGSTPHDALLVDLDGTVYRGREAIDGAVETLEAARGRGVRLAYVTNNAARGPQEVADHLAELGLTVSGPDVVTSAQAAAAVLAERCVPGTRVLVLGTEALAVEVSGVGLEPVRRAADDPGAVVQGHSPQTGWAELAEATVALGAGALWVACNVDLTLPNERGLLPGNGSMVAAVRAASGREPEVAGKPAAPLLRQSIERVGAGRPLVVGDRLDTDIAGAYEVGADSLLVLTGVSTAAQLLDAPASRRPTHLGGDLRVLDEDLDAARLDAPDEGWSADAADGDGGGVVVTLHGTGDPVAALRVLCAAVWARAGAGGTTAAVRADGDDAADVITALDLRRA